MSTTTSFFLGYYKNMVLQLLFSHQHLLMPYGDFDLKGKTNQIMPVVGIYRLLVIKKH